MVDGALRNLHEMELIINVIDRLFSNTTCSFKDNYGLYCPACGMTRALKYALRFDFINSLKSNPMILIIFFEIVAVFALVIWKKRTGKKMRIARDMLLTNIATMFVWIAFAIIRNLVLVYYKVDFLGDIIG